MKREGEAQGGRDIRRRNKTTGEGRVRKRGGGEKYKWGDVRASGMVIRFFQRYTWGQGGHVIC